MGKEKLVQLLQHGSLDRETKLMIVDLFASGLDAELEVDIVQLLTDWDAADKSIDAVMTSKLDAVKAKYDAREAELDESSVDDIESAAEDISKEQKIAKIQADLGAL
ncbi:hypothetical protein HQ524_01375 [Candidatus Uhrbacteria bacterium]|nr:hypothetical protein [Candidatus Uhrbacteria bacterium]